MIITLDGRRLSDANGTHASLQALLDEIRRTHLGPRLIVEVCLDGRILTPPDLDARLTRPPGDVEQIDLASADQHELAAEALAELARCLSDAADEHCRVAETLQSGRAAEALAGLSELLAVWQSCNRAIPECCGLLGEDLTAREIDGRPVSAYLDDLSARLRDMRSAFEARDFVLLADLLQFEMPDLCRVWQSVLSALAERVASPAAAM